MEVTNTKRLPCGCVISEYPEPEPAQRSWCVPCALIASGQAQQRAAELMAQAGQLLQVAGAGIRKAYDDSATLRKDSLREQFRGINTNNCPHGNNGLLCLECAKS